MADSGFEAFDALKFRVSRLETKVGILTWMIGTNIVLTAAILLNSIFGG